MRIGKGQAAQQGGSLDDAQHLLKQQLGFAFVAERLSSVSRQVVERLLSKRHQVVGMKRHGAGGFHLAVICVLDQPLPIGVFGPSAQTRKHGSDRKNDGETEARPFLHILGNHMFLTVQIQMHQSSVR